MGIRDLFDAGGPHSPESAKDWGEAVSDEVDATSPLLASRLTRQFSAWHDFANAADGALAGQQADSGQTWANWGNDTPTVSGGRVTWGSGAAQGFNTDAGVAALPTGAEVGEVEFWWRITGGSARRRGVFIGSDIDNAIFASHNSGGLDLQQVVNGTVSSIASGASTHSVRGNVGHLSMKLYRPAAASLHVAVSLDGGRDRIGGSMSVEAEIDAVTGNFAGIWSESSSTLVYSMAARERFF